MPKFFNAITWVDTSGTEHNLDNTISTLTNSIQQLQENSGGYIHYVYCQSTSVPSFACTIPIVSKNSAPYTEWYKVHRTITPLIDYNTLYPCWGQAKTSSAGGTLTIYGIKQYQGNICLFVSSSANIWPAPGPSLNVSDPNITVSDNPRPIFVTST